MLPDPVDLQVVPLQVLLYLVDGVGLQPFEVLHIGLLPLHEARLFSLSLQALGQQSLVLSQILPQPVELNYRVYFAPMLGYELPLVVLHPLLLIQLQIGKFGQFLLGLLQPLIFFLKLSPLLLLDALQARQFLLLPLAQLPIIRV